MEFEPLTARQEEIGRHVVDAAYTVHVALSPGLLERVYEVCFCHELAKRGLEVRRQQAFPIRYDGLEFEDGLRVDVLVGDEVICELKAVEQVNNLWKAQVKSYLKLMNKRLGFVINFNVPRVKDGITRVIC